MRVLKDFIKHYIEKRGYFIGFAATTSVTGYLLREDLRRVVSTDTPVIFDIGAHVGETIAMMSRIFDRPVIHAFEPSASSFAALSERKWRCQVSLNRMAVGEESGEGVLHGYESSSLNSLLLLDRKEPANPFAHFKDVATEAVKLTTVDDYLQQTGLDRIDLLKVDTQGYDLNVLRGARKALQARRIHNVLVELNFIPLYESQGGWQEIHRFIGDFGFGLVDYYEKLRIDGSHQIVWCTALFTVVGNT
jgi:FkbM family methyltransferase